MGGRGPSRRRRFVKDPHVVEILPAIDPPLRADVPQGRCVAVHGQLVAAFQLGHAIHRVPIAQEGGLGADDALVACGPGFALRDAHLDRRVAAGGNQRGLENRHQLGVGEAQAAYRA